MNIRPTATVALDLGTTRIKAAVVAPDGQLLRIDHRPTPPLLWNDLHCTSDANHYYTTATDLLTSLLSALPKATPIGIACQRSTFLLWDRETGDPVTPLISWQDRRAHPWCSTRSKDMRWITARTGLRLSPHYVGPKLRVLMDGDDELRRRINADRLLFGTVETYLLWRWTGGAVHQTDLSMAARTLLVDPLLGRWDQSLREFFGIPPAILPAIMPTAGRSICLDFGGHVTATIADQAAAMMALQVEEDSAAAVNLGTGGFITVPTGMTMRQIPNYLSAPVYQSCNGDISYALEGTVNGIANTLSATGISTVPWTDTDLLPETFCLPDSAGIGAPYWLAESTAPLWEGGDRLTPVDRARIVMEGVIFRVRQILTDLTAGQSTECLYLSGGLGTNAFLYRGLAACLDQTVHRVTTGEATLIGAARLAAPGFALPTPTIESISPPKTGSYLQSKYGRWRQWMQTRLGMLREASSKPSTHNAGDDDPRKQPAQLVDGYATEPPSHLPPAVR